MIGADDVTLDLNGHVIDGIRLGLERPLIGGGHNTVRRETRPEEAAATGSWSTGRTATAS